MPGWAGPVGSAAPKPPSTDVGCAVLDYLAGLPVVLTAVTEVGAPGSSDTGSELDPSGSLALVMVNVQAAGASAEFALEAIARYVAL